MQYPYSLGSLVRLDSRNSRELFGNAENWFFAYLRMHVFSWERKSLGSIFHPTNAKRVSEPSSHGSHAVLPPTELIIIVRSPKFTVPFRRNNSQGIF